MSEHVERIHTKKLKSKTAILTYCRVSNEPIGRASTGQLRLVKSLAEVETREEKPTREGTTSNTEIIKGLITQYMAYLEKEGYYEKSAYLKLMRRLARIGADLSDPENVKTIIAKQPWKNSVKMLAVYAYDIMVKQILKVQWTMPKYTIEETLPFVPEEKELDQLISACKSRRMATFLQTLKETYADPGEALKLEWKDVSENVITINGPVKGHSPRQLKVSSKLIAMLNALPKTSKRIFPSKYDDMLKGFLYVRKRAAQNLQNPRLLEISFRTFRHWGGTMIAHYTHGNVLTVQKLLGHKRIQNTMKYIHMITFKDDEFEVATATTLEEAKSVLATGFDYVTEKDGIMLFRRPKRFNA
jgi:integrase